MSDADVDAVAAEMRRVWYEANETADRHPVRMQPWDEIEEHRQATWRVLARWHLAALAHRAPESRW